MSNFEYWRKSNTALYVAIIMLIVFVIGVALLCCALARRRLSGVAKRYMRGDVSTQHDDVDDDADAVAVIEKHATKLREMPTTARDTTGRVVLE